MSLPACEEAQNKGANMSLPACDEAAPLMQDLSQLSVEIFDISKCITVFLHTCYMRQVILIFLAF